MASFTNLSMNDKKKSPKQNNVVPQYIPTDFAVYDYLNNLPVTKLPEPSFVGSNVILSSIFDAIDQNVFNCNLDGTQLEWCDKLKSRAAVSYQQHTYSTRRTYIRCSKAWIKNCTRKQFMEIVLYEMLDLFLRMNTDREDDNLKVYLLECAFNYLNKRFGTNLIINNNYTRHTADHSDVKEILDTIAKERKRSSKKALIEGFKNIPNMRVLTKKLSGNSDQFKCTKGCTTCYCEPQMVFRKCFYGANIYAAFTVDEVKCLLCEKEIGQRSLNAHLDNDCNLFKPLSDSTVCF